jgi:hypothetical protein
MALSQSKCENIHKTSDKFVSPGVARGYLASLSKARGDILSMNVLQELTVGFDVRWLQGNDLLDGLHGFVS